MFILPDPYLDFLPIPDPGSRGQKAPDPRSLIRIRNTGSGSALPVSFRRIGMKGEGKALQGWRIFFPKIGTLAS
jgi:hypothetical protein